MKKNYLTVLFLSMFAHQYFAQLCFTPTTNYSVAAYPNCITSNDFNGDGKIDIVVSTQTNISVRFGNGTGSFLSAVNYTAGTNPNSISSSDLNGDGAKDLVVVHDNSSGVWVLLNNGSGSFLAPTVFPTGPSPRSVICSDLNGDNKTDLITGNYSGGISVLLGNGVGGFSAATNFTCGAIVASLHSADFNNDGNLDIITANSGSDNFSILLGNGLGGFSSANNYSLATNSQPSSITSGDFNNDGKLDLASANRGLSNISVALGNGTGGFLAITTHTQSFLANPRTIITTDLNNDGALDLITASSSGGNIVTFFGNGTGSFVDGDLLPCGTAPRCVISADFDGNGKADLATANELSNNASVLLNTGMFNVSISSFSNVSCYGGNNGNASVAITGGTSPFTYTWSSTPTQTTQSAYGLQANTYIINVKDNSMCQRTTTVAISQPSAISASISNTAVICYGQNNGIAKINVSGGSPPYLYNWNTTPTQTTSTASNLYAGNYLVTVVDSKGCAKSQTLTVNQPQPLNILTFSVYPNTKCSGSCNGYIDSGADGGTPSSGGYIMQWDANANSQTGPQAYNLCDGTYVFTVTDANGCTSSKAEYVATQTAADPNVFLTNLAAVDQVNVSPAFSAYYSYSLPTTITPNPSNPRNFVDPGKKARFKVECTNQKGNGQSIVSGICKVRSNSPYITITDSSSALNNIGWNNNAWSADEFEINIDPNTPPGANAYIDFVVQESGQNYSTTCISIPIRPLVYAQTSSFTIDDDNNPDSQGNDNEICEPNETIEFYPWLDNISTLDAEYVRGRFENLDNHSFINIWNGIPGVGTTVYDATWWNYSFAQPQTINPFSSNTTPEYDFVFDYNNTSTINNFKLYMVMAGGFKLFSGNALSLVQWSLPYTFNNTNVISVNELEAENLSIIIYPNPTSDIFQIKSDELLKDANVKVFNSQGQIVFESIQFISEINLSNQPKGIYFLQINSGDKIINKKVIVQ